jgi:hypothetical protein
MKTQTGDQQRVILFGDSVFMASVQASLQRQPGLEVVCIYASLPDLEQQVRELTPVVVIVESCIPLAQEMLAFLQAHPDLPFIGLDPHSRVAILLSSKQQPIQTVGDLAQLIRRLAGSSVRVEGHDRNV